MRSLTLDYIRTRAQALGLEIETYSPGDRRRRFKFTHPTKGRSPTLKGIVMADIYLDGFSDGSRDEGRTQPNRATSHDSTVGGAP